MLNNRIRGGVCRHCGARIDGPCCWGFGWPGYRELVIDLLVCIATFTGGTAMGWRRVRRGKAELLAYLALVLCLIGIAIPLSHVFLHRDPLVQAILPGAAFLSLGLGIMHGMHRGGRLIHDSNSYWCTFKSLRA
jgi:hypothetical protein